MEYQILRDHEEPGCGGTRLGRLDAHRALQPQRVGQMRTTISRIRAGMSRAARARRLQVLVRGSAQPVAATAVVPGAACAAGAAVAPGAGCAAGAAVVPGAACAAGAAVAPGAACAAGAGSAASVPAAGWVAAAGWVPGAGWVPTGSIVLSAQTASARAAVARACSSLTILSASAWAPDTGSWA